MIILVPMLRFEPAQQCSTLLDIQWALSAVGAEELLCNVPEATPIPIPIPTAISAQILAPAPSCTHHQRCEPESAFMSDGSGWDWPTLGILFSAAFFPF